MMTDKTIDTDTNTKPIEVQKKAKLKVGNKFVEISIVVVLCIVVLVVFASNFDFFDKPNASTNSQTFDEYVYSLEKKVQSVVCQIEGVGKASVAITFETGVEKEYAYQTSTTSQGGTSSELILYKGEPIVIKQIAPQIKGIVVVAKGASSAVVRLNIVRTVQILLGVSYEKIEVFTQK